MPIVVIDTNILMQNYLLDNAHMLQLFIGCRQCGLPVYIPSVVQDELIGNHAKDVRTAQEKLNLEIKGLKKRGVKVDIADIKELHPDLAEQVPEGREVKVFTSSNAFYENILAPALKALEQFDDPDAVLAAIKNDEMEGFVLKQSVEAILLDELIEKAPTLDELEGPLNEPSPFTLCDFSIDEESLEVDQLEEGVITISVSGDAELELFGFIDKNEYFHIAESDVEGVTIDNADWNDYVVSAYYTMPVTFTLTAVFNIAEHSVVSASVEVYRQDDHDI